MKIDELYRDLPISEKISGKLFKRNAETVLVEKAVMAEHKIDVYINEVLTMKLMCLPEFLVELVLGRMLTEGIISSADDVAGIYVCKEGLRAKVLLKNNVAKNKEVNGEYVEVTQSCCTENHILHDKFVAVDKYKTVNPIEYSAEDIFFMADHFAEDSPLHKKTGAAHSCFLYSEGKIIFECEDIGRHNAIDKAIGFALRNNIALTRCMLYTSGRLTREMVLKSVMAQIPILVSKAAASSDAIKLARKTKLTLITNARKDSFIEY